MDGLYYSFFQIRRNKLSRSPIGWVGILVVTPFLSRLAIYHPKGKKDSTKKLDIKNYFWYLKNELEILVQLLAFWAPD